MRILYAMRMALEACLLANISSIIVAAPASEYPRVVREIPIEFQGKWDELNCRIRETRYTLDARRLSNFEADYQVLNVTLRSPTWIVVEARPGPEVGGSKHVRFNFRLVEDGNALTASNGKAPVIPRCVYK